MLHKERIKKKTEILSSNSNVIVLMPLVTFALKFNLLTARSRELILDNNNDDIYQKMINKKLSKAWANMFLICYTLAEKTPLQHDLIKV